MSLSHDLKNCQHCGGCVASDASFCPHCGSHSPFSPEPEDERGMSVMMKLGRICFLIALVAAILGYILFPGCR